MVQIRTRKDKIKAKRREVDMTTPEERQGSRAEYKYEFASGPNQLVSKNTTGYASKEVDYVKVDLRKTLIVTALAISLELCVYWVLRRGGWETINRFLNR